MALANEVAFNLFNTFSTSKFFDLCTVIFLLILDNVGSKSVFVIRLACDNLALKILVAKVSKSEVIIYLS